MRSPVTAGQPCERCGGFAQIIDQWGETGAVVTRDGSYIHLDCLEQWESRGWCCAQAAGINCVCAKSYLCPTHAPQGAHFGTHD